MLARIYGHRCYYVYVPTLEGVKLSPLPRIHLTISLSIYNNNTHYPNIVCDNFFYSPIVSESDKSITASQLIRTSVNFARSSAFCFCATCFDSKDGRGQAPLTPLTLTGRS